jgi:quinol monooxygenase YgiN
MIIVAGHVAIKPERRADAVEAVRKVVATTKGEPGCLAYDFYADLADPNRFHVYEEWQSNEALAAHLQQSHTQAFLAGIGELVASPPIVNKYEVASSGSLL